MVSTTESVGWIIRKDRNSPGPARQSNETVQADTTQARSDTFFGKKVRLGVCGQIQGSVPGD